MLRKIRLLRRFKRDAGGLAAVEFAFVLPVMLAMLFGMGELSLAVFARTSISQVASTVTDLVAQKSTLTSSDISSVYAAANTLLYPYYPQMSSGKPAIRIASVIFDTATNSTTVGKVAWVCKQDGNATQSPAALVVNNTVTFSQPLLSAGSSVIVVDVAYSYVSPTMQVITGAFNMRDRFQTKPRRVAQIPAPTSCPTS